MARFGARCSPPAAPQGIRNRARFARLRGRVPADQLRDAQPRKTAWQDRDEDRGRQLSSYLAILDATRRSLSPATAASLAPLSVNPLATRSSDRGSSW